MSHQPELLSDSPLPESSPTKRRAWLEKLRRYLDDADFRQTPGFLHASNEAILALSDPPYYTACPNPFLSKIVERWQVEREELRRALDPRQGGSPQTYAELSNAFKKEVHTLPYGALPELRDLLEENFIRDEATQRYRLPKRVFEDNPQLIMFADNARIPPMLAKAGKIAVKYIREKP